MQPHDITPDRPRLNLDRRAAEHAARAVREITGGGTGAAFDWLRGERVLTVVLEINLLESRVHNGSRVLQRVDRGDLVLTDKALHFRGEKKNRRWLWGSLQDCTVDARHLMLVSSGTTHPAGFASDRIGVVWAAIMAGWATASKTSVGPVSRWLAARAPAATNTMTRRTRILAGVVGGIGILIVGISAGFGLASNNEPAAVPPAATETAAAETTTAPTEGAGSDDPTEPPADEVDEVVAPDPVPVYPGTFTGTMTVTNDYQNIDPADPTDFSDYEGTEFPGEVVVTDSCADGPDAGKCTVRASEMKYLGDHVDEDRHLAETTKYQVTWGGTADAPVLKREFKTVDECVDESGEVVGHFDTTNVLRLKFSGRSVTDDEITWNKVDVRYVEDAVYKDGDKSCITSKYEAAGTLRR